MSVLLLILGIVLFIGLVVVHEFGHFIMARRNGVEVEEFGIFFPPRLFKHKTKAGWDFTINALPLGGFVKMKGEHDTDTEPGTYGAATTWAKSKIMSAGVVMNLLVALLMFMIVAWIGMPKLVDNQFTVKSDSKVISTQRLSVSVDKVESGSPAAGGGLKSGDTITALGPQGHLQKVTGAESLQAATKHYAGQPVEVQYQRGSQSREAMLTLNTAEHAKHNGYLGVIVEEYASGLTVQRSTWSAPIVAVGTAWQFTVLTFQGIGHALAGVGGIVAGAATHNHAAREHSQTQASSQVGGPVAIFFILKNGTALGLGFTLFIIAYISLTLGILNILPIPALDGGRLWLTLITRAIGKPLSKSKEELINGLGFVFLLGLIVIITIVDVKRHF